MSIFQRLSKGSSSKTHVQNRFEKAKLSPEMRLTFSFHVLRDGPKQITGILFRDDFCGTVSWENRAFSKKWWHLLNNSMFKHSYRDGVDPLRCALTKESPYRKFHRTPSKPAICYAHLFCEFARWLFYIFCPLPRRDLTPHIDALLRLAYARHIYALHILYERHISALLPWYILALRACKAFSCLAYMQGINMPGVCKAYVRLACMQGKICLASMQGVRPTHKCVQPTHKCVQLAQPTF